MEPSMNGPSGKTAANAASETTPNTANESERVRWVRYACDCAERVLPLAGPARPQVEAAIRAAREWCDHPTEERREACRQAADAAARAAVYAAASAERAWQSDRRRFYGLGESDP